MSVTRIPGSADHVKFHDCRARKTDFNKRIIDKKNVEKKSYETVLANGNIV